MQSNNIFPPHRNSFRIGLIALVASSKETCFGADPPCFGRNRLSVKNSNKEVWFACTVPYAFPTTMFGHLLCSLTFLQVGKKGPKETLLLFQLPPTVVFWQQTFAYTYNTGVVCLRCTICILTLNLAISSKGTQPFMDDSYDVMYVWLHLDVQSSYTVPFSFFPAQATVKALSRPAAALRAAASG